MDKEQRNRLQKATQGARKLLEEEFRSQLLQTYDIDVDKVRWADEPGAHLLAEQRLIREKLIAWIEHKEAQINDRKEALLLALREMAFTALNRFVALKLMEARELVRPCVSGGLESAGFQEFTAVAQGLLANQESSYRLYLETIFEDLSRELRALFDPRDLASLLWPKRTALLDLLEILNNPELKDLWIEDETLGWVYQYFNGNDVKEMRDAAKGGAPRNSRELAVRNQFFTPRYVVEFLTDNTLGRIWYEMRQGNTELKDRCRYLVRRPNEIWLQPGEEVPVQPDIEEAPGQEELLRQPVHIPHRQLKDPREIRMLDPACGSMHFGLYAFDLYLEIYKEAWEIAQGLDGQSTQEETFSPFVAYAAGFADKSAFLREVPRLILQHNIHGIDIDPRATQIARLTLWLRAQRAWQEQHLQVAARPPVTRSNVVCAEPMPGERELLADFVDEQFPEAERGLIQQLLEAIFDKMQLAGEAGSLLKIEEEIRGAIDQARRQWQKLALHQGDLFNAAELSALGGAGSSLDADLQNLTKDFWVNIEERIYGALRDYSEQAENNGGFQRQLFAEDAAQGFAFIESCRRRYDVSLMNPPFGDSSKQAKDHVFSSYDRERIDLGGCFITKFSSLLAPGGKLGVIANRTLLFAATLEEWRMSKLACTEAVLDLGHGVLDALVETAAFTVSLQSSGPALFIGAIDASEKDSTARFCVKSLADSRLSTAVLRAILDFRCLYGAPFAYWAPQSLIEKIKHLQLAENLGVIARQGLATCDNFRFLRLFQELSPNSRTDWRPLAKGGEYQPFWADIPLHVNWGHQGKEVKAFIDKLHGQWSRVIQSTNLYGVPGATFSARTASSLSLRVLPQDVIFDKKGPFVGAEDGSESSRLSAILIGLSYTTPYRFLIETSIGLRDATTSGSAARDYLPSTIQRLPWPDLPEEKIEEVFQASYRAIIAMRQIESIKEGCSHEHEPVPWSSHHSVAGVAKAHFIRWILLQQQIYAEADLLEALSYRSFGATEADIHSFEGVAGRSPLSYPKETMPEADFIFELLESSTEDLIGIAVNSGKSQSTIYKKGYWGDRSVELIAHICECHPLKVLEAIKGGSPPQRWIESTSWRMLSTAIGILFGRIAPASYFADSSAVLPDSPFVIPSKTASNEWLANGSQNSIFCDDAGHQLDIIYMLDEVLSSHARGISIRDLCAAVDPLRSPREFFVSKYFELHLSATSSYRRQAPIYWQLSCGSGSYSAWLYYHRFTQDTLYLVLRDFVEPRIRQAERDQFELESQGSLSAEAANRLQETQTLLQDLRILKNELDLVAPLWNPNLNDGVIINHAILWRITPYTLWQKKCKECWGKLVKGDYDWAHLAFHLWPERVIPKCTSDRSLAIAHGLEDRLWQETSNGNWLPRQLSETDLQALIDEHSNPAVKSALERFLAAPPPVVPTKKRAKRASSASPRKSRNSAAPADPELVRQVLLTLTAAPDEGLSKNAIAELQGVEPTALTAVIKQLKTALQIEQLGAARGASYKLTEQGRSAIDAEAGVEH